MKCPSCVTTELHAPTTISSVEVNICERCGGIWFDDDELRKAKDKEVTYAKWFDFDLWEDSTKFSGLLDSLNVRMCPKDNEKLFTLSYSGSDVQIDVCKKCHGIWLDKNEFQKIVDFVKRTANEEVLYGYFKNLASEAKEVFTGPESFSSEFDDVLMLVDMFKYKFATQHPKITQVLVNLPIL